MTEKSLNELGKEESFYLTYTLRVNGKMGQPRTIHATNLPELMKKLRIEFPYVCENKE